MELPRMSGLTKTLPASIVAGLALALPGPASATVHYHFEFLNGGPLLASFDYTAANFTSVDTIIPAVGLDSCSTTFGADCTSAEFHVDSTGFSGPTDIADVIGLATALP